MAPEERQSKVLTAWVRAMDDIALVYGDDGPTFSAVQAAAPGLAWPRDSRMRRNAPKRRAWHGWAVARAVYRRRSMRGGTCGSKRSSWCVMDGRLHELVP